MVYKWRKQRSTWGERKKKDGTSDVVGSTKTMLKPFRRCEKTPLKKLLKPFHHREKMPPEEAADALPSLWENAPWRHCWSFVVEAWNPFIAVRKRPLKVLLKPFRCCEKTPLKMLKLYGGSMKTLLKPFHRWEEDSLWSPYVASSMNSQCSWRRAYRGWNLPKGLIISSGKFTLFWVHLSG